MTAEVYGSWWCVPVSEEGTPEMIEYIRCARCGADTWYLLERCWSCRDALPRPAMPPLPPLKKRRKRKATA